MDPSYAQNGPKVTQKWSKVILIYPKRPQSDPKVTPNGELTRPDQMASENGQIWTITWTLDAVGDLRPYTKQGKLDAISFGRFFTRPNEIASKLRRNKNLADAIEYGHFGEIV